LAIVFAKAAKTAGEGPMPTTNLSISYRPTRIGFIVRDGSIEDIVTAAGINTLLCGGIYNPIIPLFSDTRFTESLIKLFNVDVLYGVTEDPQINDFLERNLFLRSPHLFSSDVFYTDQTGKKRMAYLDCINVIEQYWESDFRHRGKNYKSRYMLLIWSDQDPLRSLFSVSFGYFPTRYTLQEDFQDAFLKGLRSRSLTISPDTLPTAEIAASIYPIRFTASELDVYGGNFRSNGIFIGDEDNFTDLMLFWNLRAAGIAIEFLPKKHILRYRQFIERHLERLDKLPNHPPQIDDMISVYYRRDDPLQPPHQQIVDIASEFHLAKRWLFSGCDEISWNGFNIKPVTIDFGIHSTLATVEKSFDRYAVTMNLQDKPLAASIAADRATLRPQHLALSVRSISAAYPSHTLRLPLIRKLNEFYSREIVFDPWKLRVEQAGLALLISTTDNHETLYPLSSNNLVHEIFNHIGIKAEISQPGRICLRVIEKLADPFGVGGYVFRINGVRQLIHTLKADQYVRRRVALERISPAKQPFKKGRWNSRDDVFDYLLRRDFFRAGIELQCEHCRLRSWLSLKEIDDILVCTFCGNENKTSLHLRNRGEWMFRKSGLLAKDDGQQGAIPVILTLLKLSENLSNGFGDFIYTPALNLHFDSRDCETDFCAMQYGAFDQ
jgi:hypothetical protein